MARWQKAPRRRRRQGRRGALLLALVVIAAGILWWLHLQQLPTSRPLAAPIAGSATVTPSLPDFYGTHSSPVVLAGGVVVRLVDRADSNVPLALILTDPKDDPARWAGVQSSLEQFAVGSLAISAGAGTPALAEAATTLERLARRRSQPLAVIAAGGAIETALALAADSPLADRALVLLAPPAPQHPLLARLAEHAPGWLRRRLLDADDRRLSSWRGRVLVVRAHDDGTLDAVAANALVAGSHGGDVLVVPGDGFTRGPLHPDPEGWRAIADFVRGVVRKREEITVWPDSFPGESADSGR